ncbi:MAG: type II toxin-antitoxin system HipA family toxin [Desulfuromonadaceae bacterium]
MIYRLRVWEQSTGSQLPVGEMVCEISSNGQAKGAFRYKQEFLERIDTFAVDPVSIPLKTDTFSINHPGIFGVFEDSLPDDWGRNLLVRKHKIPRHDQNLPNLLLAISNSGLGALSYTGHEQPLPPATEISVRNLSALVTAAEMFEHGELRDPELTMLLGAGSSPGGARPKVVVYDETADIHYIAKFPSIKDHVDVVKIEGATIALAAKAGLIVPPATLVECGGKPVLLVRRFDVIPGGRRHMISMQTLLKAQGYYNLRYQDVLEIVRKYSSNPREDSERLYRQMVFNAIIGNTDDHLKNFWMVYDHQEKWRLSPAFDLVPDIGNRGEHVLFFDIEPFYRGRKSLEIIGRRWGIANPEAVVEQVFKAVTDWKEEFSCRGVSEADILRFREIDVNLLTV